jgi:hypothetical protein
VTGCASQIHGTDPPMREDHELAIWRGGCSRYGKCGNSFWL